MTATFMPKPFTDRTGSGMHLHLSLWDGDTPLFPAGADAPDPHGLGLSALARGFLGGVLDHAPGLQATLGPTVNSYKRTGAAAPRSGATWSPNRATYGGNDRTHFVRVPEGDRIELRGADGSTNPYLALASTLTAGLDGVARSLDPGPPGTPDAPSDGPELPPTLLHAVDALLADPVVTGALDGAGAPRRRVLRRAQAPGVPRLARHGRPLGDRPLPHGLLGGVHMCGIVGLHLRDAALYPAARRPARPGCSARSPSAAPTRRASRCTATTAATRRGTRSSRCSTPPTTSSSPARARHRVGATTVVAGPTTPDDLVAAVLAAAPDAVVVGSGTDLAVYKGTGHPRRPRRDLRPRRRAGLAGPRAHPDGHRVRGHRRGLPPVLGRPGPVPGAQRLVLQPRHDPSRAASARACGSTRRTTPRSARDSSTQRLAEGDDLEKALRHLARDVSTASTRCS